MGDGRFDSDRLTKVIADNARDTLLIDMQRLAKQSGSIINAVMLGAIAGSGRLPLAPAQLRSGDPRRRQGGGRQPARLPRRAGGGAGEGAAGRVRRCKDARRRHARGARTSGRARHAGGGAADRARRRAAAGGLSGARLMPGSISIASSRSSAADADERRARPAARANRAASRGAHVLRGRGARGASQDRARAHAPHRARGIARQGRALDGARFPQAGNRGTLPADAAVSGAPDPDPCREEGLARPRLFRHGDQFHLDQRLLALRAAGEAAHVASVRASLPAGAGADRILARPDRRRRRAARLRLPSKSPNARG